jgi:tRNA-Thr(GGU) m(6)t(6)A37 methyltransferase TsaA
MTQSLRPGEVRVDATPADDAAITFIGTIRTPWIRRAECPKQGHRDGPDCRIFVDPPWDAALAGIEDFETLEILYWLHESRRDLVIQAPGHGGGPRGTFSLRSPVRPNPIGTALVTLVRRDGPVLVVRGLDCLDGTPLVDIKPDRCDHGGPR